MNSPQFQMHDIVKNVSESHNVIGLIYQIQDVRLFNVNPLVEEIYDERFPGWKDKYIYWLYLPTPIRHVSYQDYIQTRSLPNCPMSMQIYEQSIPLINQLCCLEDALSLVEESGGDRSRVLSEQLDELFKFKE